jgi:hypothetical protein
LREVGVGMVKRLLHARMHTLFLGASGRGRERQNANNFRGFRSQRDPDGQIAWANSLKMRFVLEKFFRLQLRSWAAAERVRIRRQPNSKNRRYIQGYCRTNCCDKVW